MAASVPFSAGSDWTKTSGAAWSPTGLTMPLSGQLYIVALTVDNLGVSTPTLSLNKPAGESNTWTILEHTASASSGAASTRGFLAFIETSTSWSSHTLTATLSGSVAAKAINTGISTGVTSAQSATPNIAAVGSSFATTLAGIDIGDLVLGMISTENNAAPSWTTFGEGEILVGAISTTGGGSAANVGNCLSAYVATSAATQDFGATISDGGRIITALTPVAELPEVLLGVQQRVGIMR